MKLIKNEDYRNIVSILKMVQEKHPTAIVAGGAVRDLFLEKNVKDIDVFVQYVDTCTKMGQSTYWWNLLGMSRPKHPDYTSDIVLDVLKPVHNSDSDPDHGNDIIHSTGIEDVFEGSKDGIEVNIVVITVDPVTYVDDYFDIGLCKAYFDGTRFRFTSDFITDRDNNTFTIVSKVMTEARIAKVIENHVPRLQCKYPYHQLKVAPHNQHLLKNG